MDAFNVPKKVNRHVLKALNVLSQGDNESAATTTQILTQVKYQMRNLVPVRNIDMVIQKSLKNLSDIGLINKVGPQQYVIGSTHAPQSSAKPIGKTLVQRKHFRPGASRKESVNLLNPNLKRTQCNSEDSLSGDNYDRARKRMRSNNKKVKYVGRKTELPKSRQHHPNDDLEAFGFLMGCLSDSSLEQQLGMSILMGPKNNMKRNYDYSSKSPLVISEYFSDREPSNVLSITDLYLPNKSNNDVTNSSSPSAASIYPDNVDNKEKQQYQSQTSVKLNQVLTTEKSPSCSNSQP